MNYGSTTMATDWSSPDWRDRLLKKVLFFIPAANSHAEPQFPKVKKWLLEVDDDGTALREVGLDAEGSPIFRMPDGDDYSRASTEPSVKTLFQVTVVTIPPEGRGDSLEKMLGSMLRGVEHRRSEFRKSAYIKGTLGSAESLSVDWNGVGEGHQMKGRMICAVSEGRLYCVHFQDIASAWAQSLPEIEKALQTLAFAK